MLPQSYTGAMKPRLMAAGLCTMSRPNPSVVASQKSR
jgi:hypothetical protein